MGMVTGGATLGLVGVADRVGLFACLAGAGPQTLEQIADRSGLQPRYLQELCSGLAAAEILHYEAATRSFELCDEHAACLADESSPYFLAGWSQMIPSILNAVPGVARACREGGGVAFDAFGDDMIEGIDRSNSPGMRILLTRKWLPAMPEVVERLRLGIRVADVGCGSGAAVLTMARAYPKSRIHGFDISARSIERARAAAEAEGLANASFEPRGAEALPADPGFDLITTFDVIHDIAQPEHALKAIRRALADGGTYLMVEPDAGHDLEENLHPGGALLYAMSTLHCMTQSLAQGGVGLGAAWGPRRAQALCREAGFTRFERLDVDNPFNAFYEVRA